MKLSTEEILKFVNVIESDNTRIVVVRHLNGMKCLFEVPDGVRLRKGERVICDTRKGEAEAVCLSDSLIVGKSALDAMAELTGATFPLKKIIGKYEITMFEKGEENE